MKRLTYAIGIVFLVLAVINVDYVFAEPPHQEIIQKLETIQQTIDNQVVPKLDECCGKIGVPKTGQTFSYSDYDDGYYEIGASLPVPRFTDNGDGTVTDNLTRLLWLKNANCFELRTWSDALSDCNSLADGDCGLTDGSNAGDWRLANVKELQSLVHHGFYDPVIPNTTGTDKWTEGDSFSAVQSHLYWSATTDSGKTSDALFVNIARGGMSNADKMSSHYVWPVRGGN